MPSFSRRSLINLADCHPDLIRVAHQAIKVFDFVVIDGFRGEAEQMRAYKIGNSKAKWLQSPHNYSPAFAFDACPYPIDWDDVEAFERMGAVMLDASRRVGVEITWGGDWNNNNKTSDERFIDLPHFELRNWKGARDA